MDQEVTRKELLSRLREYVKECGSVRKAAAKIGMDYGNFRNALHGKGRKNMIFDPPILKHFDLAKTVVLVKRR